MNGLEVLKEVKQAPSFMGGNRRYLDNSLSAAVYLEDISVIEHELKVNQILKEKKPKLAEIECYMLAGYTIEEITKQHNEYFRRTPLTLEEITLIVEWLKEEQNGN